jgi:hypothetical protein
LRESPLGRLALPRIACVAHASEQQMPWEKR